MVSVADVIGLAVIVLVNSATTALMTRFFRVRLVTDWGTIVYTLAFTPLALLILTLFFGGILGLGPNLGSRAAVIAGTIILPLSLGIAFDYYWMPAPDEVELPDRMETSR